MESIYLRRGLALSKSKGFTLVELLVVLAIVMVITAVTITSQSTFNKTLVLANTAYDIALTIRSVQTYGLSSRALDLIANTGYGLHFETGTPGSIILFADTSPPPAACNTPNCSKRGDYVYTPSDDAFVQKYTLGNGMTISNFCSYSSSGNSTCANSRSGSLSSLDIVFARPDPDPFISSNRSYTKTSSACLTITSPQGGEKYIFVATSGQINANATSCP